MHCFKSFLRYTAYDNISWMSSEAGCSKCMYPFEITFHPEGIIAEIIFKFLTLKNVGEFRERALIDIAAVPERLSRHCWQRVLKKTKDLKNGEEVKELLG